jgi:hypothetical protein
VIITTNIPENRTIKYIKKEVENAQKRCERGKLQDVFPRP